MTAVDGCLPALVSNTHCSILDKVYIQYLMKQFVHMYYRNWHIVREQLSKGEQESLTDNGIMKSVF